MFLVFELGRGRASKRRHEFFSTARGTLQTPRLPNFKSRHKELGTAYLTTKVAAVWVPVGVPAELVVHLHLWKGDWIDRRENFETLSAAARVLAFFRISWLWGGGQSLEVVGTTRGLEKGLRCGVRGRVFSSPSSSTSADRKKKKITGAASFINKSSDTEAHQQPTFPLFLAQDDLASGLPQQSRPIDW